MSLITKMSFFENGIKAKVMSTELIIEANLPKKILFECLELAKRFEETFSAYREDSLLCKVNKHAGFKAIICSEYEIELFQKAFESAKDSDGVFDPTIGVLSQGLYGFGKESAKIPSKKELEKAKKLVNYENFIVTHNEVYLKERGMKLDFGGIGKGFLADKIMNYLYQSGATKALVNVGGEICTFGKNYNIALRDPFSTKNLAVIKTLKNQLTISTSGDYERYIASKENHHILDHKTAKQNHYYSSVTIIKNGTDATLLDVVATIVFNSKKELLKNISKKYNVAIVTVFQDGEIYFENFKALDIQSVELFLH
jgi:thiamine biosynthesis lipoprotein